MKIREQFVDRFEFEARCDEDRCLFFARIEATFANRALQRAHARRADGDDLATFIARAVETIGGIA